MKKFSLFFLPFFILFLIPAAIGSSTTEYNQSGTYETDYHLGQGFWNAQLTDYDIYSAGLDHDLRNPPFLHDLDNDGISELIIHDGDTIRLYQNKTLDILDGINLDALERYSNMIIYDVDDDDLAEVIVIEEESEKLHFYEFNGTSFYEQNEISLSGLSVTDGEYMIQCKDVEECLVAFTDGVDHGASSGNTYVAIFNSTTLGARTQIGTTAPSNGEMCAPNIRHIAISDYDNDAIDEYLVVFGELVSNNLNTVHMHWINTNKVAWAAAEVQEIERSISLNLGGSDGCVDENAGRYFSSPIFFNIDGLNSNGEEAVFAAAYDADEYKMYSYNSDGSFNDDYPETQQADGLLVSNVFIANAFSDTGRVDFCVAGYDTTDEILDIMCASEQTGDLIETREYFYDTPNNLTASFRNLNALAHSTKQSTSTTDGNNLDEVITSYGVFSLDEDSCSILANCDLELLFGSPKTDAATVNLDVEGVGRDDIVAVTSTNVFYIDDRFENQPGEITSYTINPCLDATWKVNTTVQVQIEVTDDEEDTVSARSFLYADEAGEQDSTWSANASSGTTFSFSFTANETSASSILELVGRDTENSDENDTIQLSYSVGSEGVEFGDCSSTVDLVSETTTGDAEITETDLTDNSIRTMMDELVALSGLGHTLIWLVVMLLVAIGIWLVAPHSPSNSHVILGSLVFIEVLLMIIGSFLGFLSIGILVATLIVMVAISAITFRKFFFGGE